MTSVADDALDYPRVTRATASIAAGTLSVSATAAGPVESARILWSWSDDRRWSEVGQAAWSSVAVTETAGAWTGSVDLAAAGAADKAIAWFVEAENTLTLGTATYGRKDASPVRFLQLPPPGICAPSTTLTCVGF